MAWQEPGDNDPKDPWGRKRPSQTPPDLDELVKQLQKKLSKAFGNGGGNGVSGGRGHGGSGSSATALGLVLGLLLLLWAVLGIYTVKTAEEAAILRFGKYVRTETPGIHWLPRLIEKKYIANVQKISSYDYKALMLTEDENIVSVSVAVQYRINDLFKYLFNVVSPNESLQHATASALRQTIGHSTLDDVLTTGREEIRREVNEKLVNIIKPYETGLLVTDVVMQPSRPPEEVKAAFDDAIAAREDEQRLINSAEAYANGVVPLAEGQAAREIADASAYKSQITLKAQAEVARFLAVLPQHARAPKVTEQRLYLQGLQEVFNRTSKILVDTQSGGNNLLYLPLDKLVANRDVSNGLAAISPSQGMKNDLRSAQQQVAQSQAPFTYGRYDRSQHSRVGE